MHAYGAANKDETQSTNPTIHTVDEGNHFKQFRLPVVIRTMMNVHRNISLFLLAYR